MKYNQRLQGTVLKRAAPKPRRWVGGKNMSSWNDCIISIIDLISVSSLLWRDSRSAVALIRRMHSTVEAARADLSHHEEVCFWNDSVLLLSFVNPSRESYINVMTEVAILKAKIDKIRKSYAICMKGKTFPPPRRRTPSAGGPAHQTKPRMLYIHASSLAFSNCTLVEKELKRHRKHWYIDSRITHRISARAPDLSAKLKLHPRQRARAIHMYTGEFWESQRTQQK